MRLRALLLASAALVVAFSCGKTEPEPTPQPEPQKQQITIPAESQAVFNSGLNLTSGNTGGGGSTGQAQTSTVKFTVPASWSADVNDTRSSTWLSVQPSSGGAGDVTMTVTAQPNTGADARSATVTLKCGSNTKSFTVNQAGNQPTVVPVQFVTLDKTTVTLEENQSTLLNATVLPENATDKTVTWSTSDDQVAIVNEGRVTTIREGEAVITAKAGDKSAKCQVKVKKSVIPVVSIMLNKTELKLNKGAEEVLVATVMPENATDKTVSWSSNPSDIVSVDQNGKVKALKGGSTVISATAGDQTATCAVEVTVPVESVSLDVTSMTLEPGAESSVLVIISPEDATNRKVTWNNTNPSVATVDELDNIKALAIGTTVITATVENKSASCTIIVKEAVVAVTSVTLNKNRLQLTKGQSESLTATVKPDNATDKTVTWSSNDETVASVTQNGRVTAQKSGTATITAKSGEKSATCEVTITTPVESVSLDRTAVSLEEGQTTTLVATISPNDADDTKVEWTTSKSSVVTVSNGVVTAVAEGEAIITAKAGGKSATCAVSVKKKVVPVSSVTLNKTSLSLNKGENAVLTATVLPENATDKAVTWSSSDETVAGISQNGQVTALKSGKATITAKAGEKSATCEVVISTPVERVSLDRTSVSLEEGQTTTLVATISPNDADEKTVEWTTSNASIATVANGVVTAVAEGTATITAKAGGKSATCAVSVKKAIVPVTSVSLNKTQLSLKKGESELLTATVKPDNATDKSVTWSSSDETVASVTQNGRVTALKSGSVSITAKAGEKSASCEVKITTPVEEVALDRTSVSLEEGQTTTLVATISPNDADDKTVVWTTSNASVATVANGLVTAVAEGTATITAKAGGKSAPCAISVKKAVVSVTSVTLNKSSLALTKGKSETLIATINPENATDKTITWTSSDATVASVTQNGHVTALKTGRATITAKAGEKSASCDVTITTPVESISLDRASVSLEEGQSTTLVATISPNDADEKTVVWSTSSASVATVVNGVVTAVAEGNATITAKAGGKSATCAVSVKKAVVAVTSVSLNKTTLSLTKGKTETLTATVKPDNATDKTVTWSSSDATVASVTQNGLIKAEKSGKATITAKAGEKSATCEVTITTPVESVSLDRVSVSLEEGQTTKLIATISPNDADEKTVQWTSSSTSVATVVDGVVTAVAEGSATITAKAGGKTATCAVSVKKAVVAVTSVTLNKTALSLTKNQSETLIATVNPDNATDKSVTWSSSDETVASITQNGLVTALKSGKATITAKAGEKSATCVVTITTPVKSITLDRTSMSLEEGQSTTLVATISPSDADDKTIVWTTSKASVVTVANGVVTAVAEGNATITATAGGLSATCAVSVKKAVVAVTSVTLNKTTLTLIKGQGEVLTATVNPDNATDKTVSWSSDDETVASVTQNGRVTALKTGNATITAKAGEKSATCKVTITTPVESVSLDRTSVSLEEGQTTTLVATISPGDADEKTVTWTTSKASIATVVNGVVTAVAEGTATITATVGGKSATCAISVKKAVIAVTSVTLNKTSLSLTKGQSEQLSATVNPDNATDKSVTWSSSDETIASVTQNGLVTAKKSGKATITAKAGEKSATCEVTITTPVESVSLDRTSVSLEEGQTTTLVATISPGDADEKTVTWTSSSPSIATVVGGVVTALAEGNATITAKAGGKSATCAVSVKKAVVAVTSVTLNKTSLSLTKGQSEQLSATVNPDNATDKSVTWSSSDETIASVTQNGQVKAVKSGKATITAKAGEKSATCEVTITTPVESVSLDRSSVSLEEGQTTTLVATISPGDADQKTVTWTTSNASVATVVNGVVTAVAEGDAVITASGGGKSATCAISVRKAVVAVTSVTLNKTTLSLTKGQGEQLSATVNPDNATDKSVTWSSSDETIASVTQNGLVTAQKSGKATITAKAGEKSATCEVTITTPVESVSLDRSSISLDEGQNATLVATISPGDADEKTVTWTTSKASVATVVNGVVTAMAEGNAIITASAGGKSATCSVTVNKAFVPVAGISLNKEETRIAIGSSETLVATVLPDNATDKAVTWRSLDTSIATVDQNGRVTAVSSGWVQIEAKAGDRYAYCWVYSYIPVSGITLSDNSVTVNLNEGHYLYATILPDGAYTESSVQWQSSKPEIVSVEQEGTGLVAYAKALAAGSATITATIEGFSASCSVDVSVPISGITLNKTELTLEKGSSETLIATILPEDATESHIEWSSSDENIVKVDNNGRVTAIAEGYTYVYAKAGGLTASCSVSVTGLQVVSITIDREYLELAYSSWGGERIVETVRAIITPEAAKEDNSISWSATYGIMLSAYMGEEVQVYQNVINSGEGTLYARSGNKQATCLVRMVNVSFPYENRYVIIEKGKPFQLQPIFTPESTVFRTLEYTCEDTSVATVSSNGVLTGLTEGLTTVVVKYKGAIMERLTVNVKKSSAEGDGIEGFDGETEKW